MTGQREQTGQWKWPVCLSRLSDRRDSGYADRTLKMARLPVPSAKKLGKSCWRGTNAAVASFRSCWRFFCKQLQALHRLPCVTLYTKQQIKNCCYILPHKNFISSVSFNALHYVCPTYYFHCLSACPVCWILVEQANGHFSLCSVFLWPVCHVLKGQKNGSFPLSRLPVPYGTGRWAIFKVLYASPVCLSRLS